MKINWGVGITILYTGFVAMILVLVGMSASQKIDLVTNDYYGEELQFQDKINKTKRANELVEPLTWQVSDSGLLIRYPKVLAENNFAGKVKLYCPSNEKNDRLFDVNLKDYQQFIPASKIPEGRYHLQIDWKSGSQTYWNEGVVRIGQVGK